MAEIVEEVEDTEEKAVSEVVETVSKYDETVEAWFSKHFHGLNVETSVYNKFYRAKEELKTILKG